MIAFVATVTTLRGQVPPDLTPTPNCTSPADFSVASGQTVNISVLVPNASGATNKIFNIGANATLVINSSFGFRNCTVRCGAGASIITQGSSINLIADNTAFSGCGNSWNGITLNPGATSTFTYCKFENANRALLFPLNYNFTQNRLIGCWFQNNLICMELGEFTGGADKATVGFTQCFGNVMINSNLGIFVQRRCVLSFGTSGGARNVISSMRLGIRGDRLSTITLANTEIRDMTLLSPNHSGIGLFFRGTTLSVYAPTSTSNCVFHGNHKAGISIENASELVSIQGAAFSGIQDFGVHVPSSTNPCGFDIRNNTFEHTYLGSKSSIFIQRPSGTLPVTISQNTITAKSGGYVCRLVSFIDVVGSDGATSQFIINNNTINNAANCRHGGPTPNALNNGIFVSGPGDNVICSANTINYTATADQNNTYSNFGIAFVGMIGKGHQITNANRVTSTLVSSGTDDEAKNQSVIQCAYHVESVKDPFFCGNFSDDTHRGLHLGGTLGDALFSNNDMGRHVHGLYCSAGTKMQSQFNQANIWLMSAADYISNGEGARHVGTDEPAFQFFVNPAFTGHMPPSIDPAVGWFLNSTSDPLSCAGEQSPGEPNFTGMDLSVAKGNYPTTNPAAIWDLRKNLWTTLLRNPTWVSSNAAIQAFHNSTNGTSEQRYAQAFLMLGEALRPVANLAQQWSGLQVQTSLICNEIARLDSLLGLDTANINPVYAAALTQQIQQLGSLGQALENLDLAHSNNRDNALLQLQGIANQLPSATAYEGAWKLMLSSSIHRGLGNELTQAQRDALIAIANDCPDEAGEAVIFVPAYMQKEDSYPYMGREDFSTCERDNHKFSSSSNALLLSPNPASDQLSITYPGVAKGSWQVFSSTGVLMLEGDIALEQSNSLIQTGKLVPGIYFLLLRRGAAQESTRFVISK
jgi:hypothetical protein